MQFKSLALIATLITAGSVVSAQDSACVTVPIGSVCPDGYKGCSGLGQADPTSTLCCRCRRKCRLLLLHIHNMMNSSSGNDVPGATRTYITIRDSSSNPTQYYHTPPTGDQVVPSWRHHVYHMDSPAGTQLLVSWIPPERANRLSMWPAHLEDSWVWQLGTRKNNEFGIVYINYNFTPVGCQLRHQRCQLYCQAGLWFRTVIYEDES
ncbi:hypothetical protein GGX14DRAFT_542227 [Mycena pura]|uniref:Uncharacterized protein n=1 Tax=Mycena pura TaxID=153505 RepID=A0AAD6VIG7_9AGAR|nr:hypothetical protein GGX14DRAFT_542227 [Mycena pura]